MSLKNFIKEIEDLHKLLIASNMIETLDRQQIINTTIDELEKIMITAEEMKNKYNFTGNREAIISFNDLIKDLKKLELPLKYKEYQKLASNVNKILKTNNFDRNDFIDNIQNEEKYIFFYDDEGEKVELFNGE